VSHEQPRDHSYGQALRLNPNLSRTAFVALFAFLGGLRAAGLFGEPEMLLPSVNVPTALTLNFFERQSLLC
jgi:hypothetical protein